MSRKWSFVGNKKLIKLLLKYSSIYQVSWYIICTCIFRVYVPPLTSTNPGMFIVLVLLVALLGWAWQAIRPPPPKICGSPGGPPVTAPRIKLRDGRHMAYREHGVSKEVARYKIIYIHGLRTCRHDLVVSVNISQVRTESFKIEILNHGRVSFNKLKN